MAFIIDESFLPATLTAPPMTDAQFVELCAEHPDLEFETTAEGEIIVMAPTYSLTGARNFRILGQLYQWAEHDGRGIACDSSTGYVLPNGARRSPDASWTTRKKVEQLSQESREGFWRLCPDFVIELKSKIDRMPALQKKMREWIANGAELGWLIDPEGRTVEIYRPRRDPELLSGVESIAGEIPVQGFVLRLEEVWNPLNHSAAP